MIPGNVRSINDSNNNNNNAPNCKEYIQKAWEKLPLYIRIMIILSLSLYLLSFLAQPLIIALVNIPHNTVYKFRFWTLYTSIYVNLSIFNIVFAFMSWIPSAIVQENQSGTIKYMFNIFMHSSLIQILYTILAIMMTLKDPSSGLWPLLMAEITLNSCENPERDVMMMFIPYPFKAKYYPWALLGFFAVMNQFNIQYDTVIGILYGYLYFYYLKNYLVISDNFLTKVDNCIPFKYLKRFTGKYFK